MKLKIVAVTLIVIIGLTASYIYKNTKQSVLMKEYTEPLKEETKIKTSEKLDPVCAIFTPVAANIYDNDDYYDYPYEIPVGTQDVQALVKNIDQVNKTITLDFVEVDLIPFGDVAGYEPKITNNNNKLRTFHFDDTTLIYMEYLGGTSLGEKFGSNEFCQKQFADLNIPHLDWGWYSLAKSSFDAAEGSPDFAPYVDAGVLNDDLIYLMRPTLSS